MTTPIQLPVVFGDGNVNDDDVVKPASLPICCTRLIAPEPETIDVESAAESLLVLLSPPPLTDAVLVTVDGALDATVTVSVMTG